MIIQGENGQDLEVRDPNPTYTIVAEAVAEFLKGTYFVPDARVIKERKKRNEVGISFCASFKNERVTIEIYDFQSEPKQMSLEIYVERESVAVCHYSNELDAELLKGIILTTIKNIAL